MRLKVLSLIVLAAAICVPALCSDAPMFRGNPQHSGVYNAEGVPAVGGVKWKFHTGGLVMSSPAGGGDVVFVGSTGGNFYALDRESGALRWKFKAKSRITSSPAVSEGLVYLGPYDANLY